MLNYVHLTETGFEKNSPLIYRKLTFSVEGKMGISEKLDKDSHKSCFKWFNMFENNDLILIVTYIATG